jgi:hypothetical protein
MPLGYASGGLALVYSSEFLLCIVNVYPEQMAILLLVVFLCVFFSCLVPGFETFAFEFT